VSKGQRVEHRGDAERAALALVQRRPRTEEELRRALRDRGDSDDEIESTLARLRDHGYVDDFALAVHYLVSRAERLGHAPARLLAELRARGVPESVLRSAERDARETHGIDDLGLVRRLARRRGAGPDAGPARNARVYHALLRAGYDADTIRTALGAPIPGDDEGECER
jgi:regulatory protein